MKEKEGEGGERMPATSAEKKTGKKEKQEPITKPREPLPLSDVTRIYFFPLPCLSFGLCPTCVCACCCCYICA